MEEKRKVKSKMRYILAFLIGTLIFLIGFGITYSFSYLEYQRVVSLQDPTSYEIFIDKLQYSLFEENICSNEGYLELSRDLSYQGQLIGDLEQKLGKDNPNVLFRKRFYTLIQLEHLEFVNIINRECNKSIDTILFFYSNNEKDIDKSIELGNILGRVYGRNENNLALYSIDINLNSELINNLKKKYNIENKTVIIVNGNYKFYEINNIDEIEKYLKREDNQSIKL